MVKGNIEILLKSYVHNNWKIKFVTFPETNYAVIGGKRLRVSNQKIYLIVSDINNNVLWFKDYESVNREKVIFKNNYMAFINESSEKINIIDLNTFKVTISTMAKLKEWLSVDRSNYHIEFADDNILLIEYDMTCRITNKAVIDKYMKAYKLLTDINPFWANPVSLKLFVSQLYKINEDCTASMDSLEDTQISFYYGSTKYLYTP